MRVGAPRGGLTQKRTSYIEANQNRRGGKEASDQEIEVYGGADRSRAPVGVSVAARRFAVSLPMSSCESHEHRDSRIREVGARWPPASSSDRRI